MFFKNDRKKKKIIVEKDLGPYSGIYDVCERVFIYFDSFCYNVKSIPSDDACQCFFLEENRVIIGQY